MKKISVDCIFDLSGAVRVRRVQVDGEWHVVEQGRQWRDDDGRHVLVMLPNNLVRELVLSPRTLVWELVPLPKSRTIV